MESAAGPKRGASGAQPLASRRASPRLAAASLPWAEQLDVHTAYQPALQPRPQEQQAPLLAAAGKRLHDDAALEQPTAMLAHG